MAAGNHVAPTGQVYVCGACGKRSRDKWGEMPITRGWDESCALNSILCYESHIRLSDDDLVVEVRDGGRIEETPC